MVLELLTAIAAILCRFMTQTTTYFLMSFQ